MKKFNSIDGIILQKNDNQNSGLGNPKVVRLDDKLFTKPKQKVPSPAPKKPAPEIKKIPTINKVRNLDSDLSETLKNLEAQKTNELPIRDTTTKKKSRKNKLSHKERKLLKKEKKLTYLEHAFIDKNRTNEGGKFKVAKFKRLKEDLSFEKITILYIKTKMNFTPLKQLLIDI